MVPMSQIKIEVAGVSYAEARELAGLLEHLEGVESTRVPVKTRDHAFDPNSLGGIIPEMRASSEVHNVIVDLVVRSLGAVAEEVTKDSYAALKKRIMTKFAEWRESKEQGQRERIVFMFDDEHVLVNKGETDD